MSPRALLALFALGLACAAALAVQAARLHQANRALLVATAGFESASRDVQRVLHLRSRHERLALGERPAQDTLARITAALRATGLPTERLKDLSRESDAAAPGPADGAPAYRTQSMRLTLQPITVEELGRFLAHWTQNQRLWTVARIDLAHVGPDDEPTGTYNARITICAMYLAGPADNGRRP